MLQFIAVLMSLFVLINVLLYLALALVLIILVVSVISPTTYEKIKIKYKKLLDKWHN